MASQKTKQSSRKNRLEKTALAIIIAGMLIRIIFASFYHPSGDACYHFSVSRFIEENKVLPFWEQFGRDEPFWAPPLFHIIIASVYGIFIWFGKSVAEFAIKFASPLFSSATLVLVYITARKLYGEKKAVWAVFFMAFLPLSMDYGIFGYVDGMLSFLAMLSIYFIANNRIVLSSITAGLAVLTKYNGAFIIPVLIYFAWKKSRKDKRVVEEGSFNFKKAAFCIIIISAAIGSIWFIRNWELLGNPVWPFFNNVFKGYNANSFENSGVGEVSIKNLFDYRLITTLYLGIFGIPDGNINSLSFVKLPYMNILLFGWIAATILFLIPALFGIKKQDNKVLYLWIGSFAVLAAFYAINASFAVSRFALPAFPAIAMIWANGMAEGINKIPIKKVLTVMIVLIAAGFVVLEAVKIRIASNEWERYETDFKWIKENTPKNSVFLGGQCLSYNIDRQTYHFREESVKNADYIFINRKFKKEPRSIMREGIEDEDKWKQVYYNEETGTEVYAVRP